MITMLEVIDPGAQGEYGFFGKKLCVVDVVEMSPEQIEAEKAELIALYGKHVSIVEVEAV